MVNFKIKCGSEEKVLHYNRLSPVKGLPRVAPKNKINVSSRSQVADDTNTIPNDSTENSESSRIIRRKRLDSSSSSRDENETDTEDEYDGGGGRSIETFHQRKKTQTNTGSNTMDRYPRNFLKGGVI